MNYERFSYFSNDNQVEIEFKGRFITVNFTESGKNDLKNPLCMDPACESESETTIESISWQSDNVASQDLHQVNFEVEYNDKNWKRIEKFCPSLIKKINIEIF